MSARKEYEMLFQLNAELGAGYTKSFGRAQAALIDMQKDINALNKTQADIRAYQKQNDAIDSSRKKLEMLNQQYANLQAEMRETGDTSAQMKNRLLAKQNQIDRTTASIAKQTAKLHDMGDALEEAGVDTKDLTASSKKLEAQIEDIKGKQDGLAESALQMRSNAVEAFTSMGSAISAAGITVLLREIASGFKACMDAVAEYGGAMANVEALSGATKEEMAALSAEAKYLGATTKFTAKEAGDAMGFMAMAGWDAKEILDGMESTMLLAAASGEDLALVSDIVTDSLTAFGLQAKDTAHFSDVLATAATASNTDIEKMGDTFRYVGPVAGALKYSIEDTAVAVGLMANAGIKSTQAGTSLRAMMTNLVKPTKQVAGYMDALGLSVTDAGGNVKPFHDLVVDLRDAFDGLTDAQKAEYAAGIAGAEGMSGMLAIINASDKDFDDLTASIGNATGAAQRMSDVKLDNLQGDMVLLDSAVDGLKISLGEQFEPEVRELVQTGTAGIDLVHDFVADNPAVVKALGVFTAGIGAAAAGMAGYVAVTKAVIPLMGMFTAAIPGVNMIAGVSLGIAALGGGIAAMTAAANEGVPSVRDLTEEARELRAVMDDSKAAYQDTATETMAAADLADRYIDKLEALESAGLDSADAQAAYHDNLAVLSQLMPDLADKIDLSTDSIDGGTAALRANTEEWKRNALEQAKQEYLKTVYAEYADTLIEAEKNSIGMTKAQADLAAAEDKLQRATAGKEKAWADAKAQADDYYDRFGVYKDATEFLGDEYQHYSSEVWEAERAVSHANRTIRNHQSAMDEDADAVEAAKAEMELAEDAANSFTAAMDGATSSAEGATDGQEVLMDAVNATMEQVQALTEAYNVAYEAAYDSVTGQYALWDEAEEVVATSAGAMNTAIETQIGYWSDYNENLEKLRERSAEIEGLGEVIASFADGSAESVAAVAGMADASDADLGKMVDNWKELQTQQEEASGSIADLKTDFTSTMDELQTDLAADIEAMDLGDEAAESGRQTVQGFINGAVAMKPRVSAAYAGVAKAAIDAINKKMDIHSPSRVTEWSGEMAGQGFINGAEKMLLAVGTTYGKLGETGSDALYAGALKAHTMPMEAQLFPGVYAGTTSGAGQLPPISINITVQGSAGPETVNALKQSTEDIARQVMTMIDQRERDHRRRAFT